MPVKVGVLALQGATALHQGALTDLGATSFAVRTPDQLAEADALVVPGGESTTMSMLLESSGLADPLAERLAAGLPTFGTCAGMILLARTVHGGRPGQRAYDAIDIGVQRNAFGRQVDSFELDLAVEGLEGDFPAVFIRAPFVTEVGGEVEVLASVDGHAVLCRQDRVLVSAFHPELSGDHRLHALFLALID